MRSDLEAIAAGLRALPGLRHLGITSNGIVLGKKLPGLQRAGVDMLNISLDTLLAPKFELLTRRRGLERVLESIDTAIALGYDPVKVNCVIMRGVNDDEIPDFVVRAWVNEAFRVRSCGASISLAVSDAQLTHRRLSASFCLRPGFDARQASQRALHRVHAVRRCVCARSPASCAMSTGQFLATSGDSPQRWLFDSKATSGRRRNSSRTQRCARAWRPHFQGAFPGPCRHCGCLAPDPRR